MSDNKMNSGQADARQILLHALESVFPESAVRRHVSFDKKTQILTVDDRKYNLADFERVFVVGGGKAGRGPAPNWSRFSGSGSPPAC